MFCETAPGGVFVVEAQDGRLEALRVLHGGVGVEQLDVGGVRLPASEVVREHAGPGDEARVVPVGHRVAAQNGREREGVRVDGEQLVHVARAVRSVALTGGLVLVDDDLVRIVRWLWGGPEADLETRATGVGVLGRQGLLEGPVDLVQLGRAQSGVARVDVRGGPGHLGVH